MSRGSLRCQSSLGEQTIFAFQDLFVTPSDATAGRCTAADAFHYGYTFADGNGSPIYSRTVNIGTNLDFPVNNAIIEEIADCLEEEASEIYSYACYRPGDRDWQLFDNSMEAHQLADSDFFSDADACCGYPNELSVTLTDDEVDDEISSSLMHDARTYHDVEGRLRNIREALDDFEVRSSSGYIPTEFSHSIHQEPMLQHWQYDYQWHEENAVKFQGLLGITTMDSLEPEKIEHTTQRLTDTVEEKVPSSGDFEPTVEDTPLSEEIDQFFKSNLVSFKDLFMSKAIQKLTPSRVSDSNVAEAAENDTGSPKSNERSNVQSASLGERLRRPAPKKRANDGSDNDNDRKAGNNKKHQKEAHDANGTTDTRKLACPFRKNNPTKFGLGNPRYKTCATGSWENVGKLKDSHIYRSVHTAQCCGCKAPMQTELEFEKHRTAAILDKLRTNCTSCEGLFVHEVEDLRKLKVKGLGLKRSWEEVYKTLFPTSVPIPSPWWIPPYDSSYQESDQQELRRRIVAYLEAQFQCVYDKIIASQDEIVQSLLEVIPERDSISPSPPVGERAEIAELDPGEGPSVGQWEASLPMQFSNDLVDVNVTSDPLLDQNYFDFDMFDQQFGASGEVGGLSLETNFENDPASKSMEITQLDIHAQCIRNKSFVYGREGLTAGVVGDSCQGKGKGIDIGGRMDYGPLTGYQEGYQSGFSDGLKQGKDLGYKAGWKKGHITGYGSGMEAVEEGNVQLKAFQSCGVFDEDELYN